jgi:hypothetical protein
MMAASVINGKYRLIYPLLGGFLPCYFTHNALGMFAWLYT